jgi:hypothetical protein
MAVTCASSSSYPASVGCNGDELSAVVTAQSALIA